MSDLIPLTKVCAIRQRTLGYLFQPGIKLASLAGAQHQRKLLDELVGQSDFFIDLTYCATYLNRYQISQMNLLF